tara:strand:- start:311 stop:637 length:327 start_codon:yes stop_codon:yes gene_type:complete
MKQDKLFNFLKTINLEDKQFILNYLLVSDDTDFFLHSNKKGIGFSTRSCFGSSKTAVFCTLNGLTIQINIELDNLRMCAVNEKKSKIKGDKINWNKTKLNSFEIITKE